MKKILLIVLIFWFSNNFILAKTTTIVLWTSAKDPLKIKVEKQIAEVFNQQNPNIKVKVVRIPGFDTDINKLATAVSSGTGPDIFVIDRFTVAERAAAHLLQDLTKYIKDEKINLEQQYLKYAWEEVLYRGKVYALPLNTDVRALYYRKDLLRQVGIDPGELDPSNGPITTQRIREIAFRINKTDKQGHYTQIGFIPWGEQGWHYSWGFAFGGEFYNKQRCAVTPTHPGIKAGFQFLYDWAKAMDPQKIQLFQNTYYLKGTYIPPEKHPFIMGNLAMLISGDWFAMTLIRYGSHIDWGITYIPTNDRKKVSWSGGRAIVIPKGAKHPKAAYKYIRFHSGAGGQLINAKILKRFPTWKPLIQNKDLFSEKHPFFQELLPFSKSRPPLPVGVFYWNELSKAQNRVVLNQKTPEKALQMVTQKVQKRLERYCQ